MARCPECGQKLILREGLKRWDHIYCKSCHAELEVLSPVPLELEAVFEFEDEELVHDLNDNLDDDVEEDSIDWDENDDGDEDADEDEDADTKEDDEDDEDDEW
jgi:lysine biosynthesis protein LysW